MSIASVAKHLATTEVMDTGNLTALFACKLIPLDKNPGLRPIGIGEVLRRIISKAITTVLLPDLQQTAGALQLCVGQPGGSEAGIYTMSDIFNDDCTHGIIQVDVDNAFNGINRSVFLQNLHILCPEIALYAFNCYQQPACLFVIGGMEISSSEGTTQGDPIAMPCYAIGILTLLSTIKSEIQQVAFADDLTGAGKLSSSKVWWSSILEYGPYLGYYAKPTKSWLIIKNEYMLQAEIIFHKSGLNISSKERKHLGAFIGSENFRSEFVESLVGKWVGEISKLCDIAKIKHMLRVLYSHMVCSTIILTS